MISGGRTFRAVLGVGVLVAALASGAAPTRTLAWMATYNNPVNGDDVPQAVAVDPGGNVVVAGWSKYSDSTTAADILVIKYDRAGQVAWTRTYNGIPGGTDYAFGVALGPDGSVYVAGSVSVTGGVGNAWLRKYTPAGDVVWTTLYASPSAGDQAVFYAVAVDPVSGSVFVAGTEVRSDLFQFGNGLVAKVAPATGALLWVTTFDGGGSGASWDEALGVAVDPDGNAVVTGYETVTDPSPPAPPGGSSLSYDLMGRSATRFDPSDTIDTRTIVRRYDAAGGALSPLAAYAGDPAHLPNKEAGNAVAVAADGAVFVAGTEQVPGPADFQRWIRMYAPPNGPYLGAPLWTKVIGESTGGNDRSDTATAVAMDPLGGVLVAGESSRDDIHQGRNFTLAEYDPVQGFAAWETGYDSGYNLDDMAQGVAANAAGDVALVGWSRRSDLSQKKNWVVLAYRPAPPEPPLLGAVRAWPSPFNPRTAQGGEVKFGPLPYGSTVHIFTLGGALVREVRERSGTARWDGRTGDGRPVADGVYAWVARVKGQAPVRGTVMVFAR